MHYAALKDCDTANGPGVRITLFVSGCTNRCKNCFQPETWDFEYGQPFTDRIADVIVEMLDRPFIQGLTILGGEPIEPRNQDAVLSLIEKVKEKLPEKDIWVFSGFTYEQLHNTPADRILDLIDVLVDGRYVDELKSLTLQFRGSTNQRLIDMKRTRECEEVTLLEVAERI